MARKLKINASTFATSRYLIVDDKGIKFCETAVGGNRRFNFSQIDLILVSDDNLLAFQVGSEVFSLPFKPAKKVHLDTVDALVREVELAHGVDTTRSGSSGF